MCLLLQFVPLQISVSVAVWCITCVLNVCVYCVCRWVCRDFPDLKLAVEKFILNSFEPTRSVGDTALPFVCVVDELYASQNIHC